MSINIFCLFISSKYPKSISAGSCTVFLGRYGGLLLMSGFDLIAYKCTLYILYFIMK